MKLIKLLTLLTISLGWQNLQAKLPETLIKQSFATEFPGKEIKTIEVISTIDSPTITVYETQGIYKTKETLFKIDTFVTKDLFLIKPIANSGDTFNFTLDIGELQKSDKNENVQYKFNNFKSELEEQLVTESALKNSNSLYIILNRDTFDRDLNTVFAKRAEQLKEELNSPQSKENIELIKNTNEKIKIIDNKIEAYWPNIYLDGRNFKDKQDFLLYFDLQISKFEELNPHRIEYFKYYNDVYSPKLEALTKKNGGTISDELYELEKELSEKKVAYNLYFQKEFDAFRDSIKQKEDGPLLGFKALTNERDDLKESILNAESSINFLKNEIENNELIKAKVKEYAYNYWNQR